MSSNCTDPNTILVSPECKTIDVDAYNSFINQMNLYCSNSDHVITNPNCIDYINNNKFIQMTEFNKNLKKKAVELCLDNKDPLYDSNCVNLYNTKPLELIRKEEEAKKYNIYIWIAISLFIFILISSYLYVKKGKKEKLNTIIVPKINTNITKL